jgi:hypothetical protein
VEVDSVDGDHVGMAEPGEQPGLLETKARPLSGAGIDAPAKLESDFALQLRIPGKVNGAEDAFPDLFQVFEMAPAVRVGAD